MKQEATLGLGDGDQLSAEATDADVRLSFTVGKPGAGCPNGHHWSIPVDRALRFARGIQKTARLVRAKGMSFGDALEVLKAGGIVTRPSWNGEDLWMGKYQIDRGEQTTLTRPILAMGRVNEAYNPWRPTLKDMLAEDWEVVE